jgi:hypothetical protein
LKILKSRGREGRGGLKVIQHTQSSLPSLMAVTPRTKTSGIAVVTGLNEEMAGMSCRISWHRK